MSNLPLTPVVDVNIISSPIAQGRLSYNLGLILGDSTVLDTTTRVKLYSSVADMLSDGFLSTDPEVEAATIYFSQSPQPNNVVIGRYDRTTPETIETALNDCRTKNGDWYACYITEATDAEIEDAAALVEAMIPESFLFSNSSSTDIKDGTGGNLAETLQGLTYRRTLLQYSASTYAAVAIMGYAMGANGFDKPTYTLQFKQEIGITPDTLTTSEVTTIEGYNANVYIQRGNYKMFENGKTPSGIFFDEIIGLDMLAESVRVNVMNLFTSTLKIPQTNAGVTQILTQITGACDEAVRRNFIAPGIWTGAPFGNIETGDTLPLGYAIIAQSVADQSQADREARKAPDISVLVKLAGAIHSAIINVYVNR